jgi:hypothetical protein
MEFETAISSHTTEQVGYSESGNIWSHPQPDTLLMENFFNDRRSKTLALPEQRLMRAILEDAVASFQKYAQQRMERGSNFSMMSRNGSSRPAVVGFSTLKVSVALSALTPITFVGGCCTGRKRIIETSHAPLGSAKKTPELSYSAA